MARFQLAWAFLWPHATVQIKGTDHSGPQFLCFKRESVTVPTGKHRHHQEGLKFENATFKKHKGVGVRNAPGTVQILGLMAVKLLLFWAQRDKGRIYQNPEGERITESRASLAEENGQPWRLFRKETKYPTLTLLL